MIFFTIVGVIATVGFTVHLINQEREVRAIKKLTAALENKK